MQHQVPSNVFRLVTENEIYKDKGVDEVLGLALLVSTV